jgi:hypothetical protein
MSADIYTVLLKHKLPVTLASIDNFAMAFEHVVDPSYVLRDTVSLYTLDLAGGLAVFIEVDNANVDRVYTSTVTPFFFDSQYHYARRVITMPLSSLIRLGKSIGTPLAPVVVVNNTTRCGSMLLCQMLEAVPQALCLREPDALTSCLFAGATDDAPETHELTTAVINVLCKPRLRGGETRERGASIAEAQARGEPLGISLYVIKPRGHCIKLLPAIDAALGTSSADTQNHQLFLYRGSVKTVQSMTRAFGSESDQLIRGPLLQWRWLRRLLPARAASYTGIFVISDDPKLDWARDFDYFGGLPLFAKYWLMWAVMCNSYVTARCRDANAIQIAGVKYEHIIENPKAACTAIFSYCGLGDEHVAAACDAMMADQHAGSIFSSTALRHRPPLTIDTALRKIVDDISLQLDVPTSGVEAITAVLPGTITMFSSDAALV